MNLLIRRKVDQWLNENVIDKDTHSKILSFEESKFSLSSQHFILGLGAVAIAVGIISVIAANWYVLTKEIKIISNITLLLFLSIMTYLSRKKSNPILLELFSFLYFASIIATFALIGQIYNVSNEHFLTLSYWLLIGSPIIAFTSTKYSAYFYSLVVLVWGIEGLSYIDKNSSATFLILIPLSMFYLSLIFSKINNTEISKALINFSRFSFSIIFLIIAQMYWKDLNIQRELPSIQNIVTCLVFSLPAFYFIFKNFSKRWFVISALIFAYIQIPFFFMIGEQKEISALFFIIIWAAIAYESYATKNQKLFDISFFIISLRIIIIYFEVFGSLLDTGIGLIGSGCFLIAAFYLWNTNRKTIWNKLVKNEK